MRWFLPEEPPLASLCEAPDRQRVDRYHLPSLTPGSGWKQRGVRGVFELKVRRGQPVLVRAGEVTGVCEQWVKHRIDGPVDLDGPWVDVHKAVWATSFAQITQIDVGDQRWWSICTRVTDSIPHFPAELEAAIASVGLPGSYPTWLLMTARGVDVH